MMPDVAEPLDIPPAWVSLARQLAAIPARRVIVLGATDVGKSSFCRFLGLQLARRGETVDLLDTDLGQKMIGPPACVTLSSCCSSGGSHLKGFRFVGEVSPTIDMAGVIAASARLANRSVADRLIVNTSGLINGAGILLKRWKLEALNPDHVVGIARGDELAPILAPLPQHVTHLLHPSHEARRKSVALRARNRRDALSRALGSYRTTILPGLVVEDLHRKPLPPDCLRLCSLGDDDGEDRGLGLVRLPDYLERGELFTNIRRTNLRCFRLGMGLTEFGGMPSGKPYAASGTDDCLKSAEACPQKIEADRHA